MKKLLLSILVLVLSTIAFAQNSVQEDSLNLKKEKKINITPLPVIASTPATGWMFGVAPAANWIMGNPETTSISSALSSFVYTTKKQFIFTFKTSVFLDNDSWNLIGDWRYFITSQPTFGLGTGPQSAKLVSSGIEYEDGLISQGITDAQFMKFNYLRFHETAMKRLGNSRFFAGLGYHLDIHSKIDDQLLDLEAIPSAITSHYAYSEKYGFDKENYTLSGVSVNALYDSRDNTINPYDGRYAFASLRMNTTWLGSDQTASTLWLEYRDYFNLSKSRPRNLIALWLYSSSQIKGNLPYMDLPALGWDQFGRSGRAYPQGRFRGQSVLYGEAEWRFPLQKKSDTFGGVVFVNATSATNKDANIKMLDYVNTGYGIGLRWMVDKKARTNICLDYGWGSYGAQGFYLSVNEVF